MENRWHFLSPAADWVTVLTQNVSELGLEMGMLVSSWLHSRE